MDLTPALLLNALMIFGLRILDVSLGTLRIGMIVRGRRNLAAVLSFFESLIWLMAAAQVLGNLESPVQFVAYAGGTRRARWWVPGLSSGWPWARWCCA